MASKKAQQYELRADLDRLRATQFALAHGFAVERRAGNRAYADHLRSIADRLSRMLDRFQTDSPITVSINLGLDDVETISAHMRREAAGAESPAMQAIATEIADAAAAVVRSAYRQAEAREEFTVAI